MTTPSAPALERSCAFVAAALSGGRRTGVRLMSGDRRTFGLNQPRTLVSVPYPLPFKDWSLRTVTCGVALQCSPSKDRIALYPLNELTSRERSAVSVVEGAVAFSWVADQWPGLMPELRRHLPDLELIDPDLAGSEILRRAAAVAGTGNPVASHPLLGQLPLAAPAKRALTAALKRMYGRLPWSSKFTVEQQLSSMPVGGDGGVRDPNPPPPSRPGDDEVEIRPDQRAGIPYPEWNVWRDAYLPNHVAVLERSRDAGDRVPVPLAADVRRWFEQRTHRAIRNRLEDGCDLDVDSYVSHHIDVITGIASQPRLFHDLQPSTRDVATALLLDGSSSLGVHGGRIFELELACADALSRAMTLARERHGVFVFSGNTRHRVKVRCLKDFQDRHMVAPSSAGLVTAGYTRLGAPLRHLTSRLLALSAQHRLLIVIGDGLMSDEGYEGEYARADVAHAVEEAHDSGVTVYYLGVGPARVDPLPEVFGPRCSRRIRNVEQLPGVLAHVHRELLTT